MAGWSGEELFLGEGTDLVGDGMESSDCDSASLFCAAIFQSKIVVEEKRHIKIKNG